MSECRPLKETRTFASPTFQQFTKVEIGYTPHAATCESCAYFRETERPYISACAVLGPLGLIEIGGKGGYCKRYEVATRNCVPV